MATPKKFAKTPHEPAYRISESTYSWSMGLVRRLVEATGLNLKVHGDSEILRNGDVFLFNHFVHLETALPLHLIYEKTGAYARSVAHRDLFEANDRFGQYLADMGAIPHDHPRLFPLLVANVLRGHKMIIFPEGKLVRDRRMMDEQGNLGVFSDRDQAFRPLHRGGAALAVTLDMLKTRLRQIDKAGDKEAFGHWAKALEIEPAKLREAIAKPTRLVPATITYYPIRTLDNTVSKLTKLLAKGTPKAVINEMILQGNMLLQKTDMDVVLGEPIDVRSETPGWQNLLLEQGLSRVETVDQLFNLKEQASGMGERVLAQLANSATDRIRDLYMERLFRGILVNQSHLAAKLLMTLFAGGRRKVEKAFFHRALYLAIKGMQRAQGAHLHRSLRQPERYRGTLTGENEDLMLFLESARNAHLISWDGASYTLSEKLREIPDFKKDRLAHPVMLYANEVAPLPAVREVIEQAIDEAGNISEKALARRLFDDEVRSYKWRREFFNKPRFKEINDKENLQNVGEPFLLAPLIPNGMAVVLVHGFRASPGQLRGFGETLRNRGYVVVGVRLAGHGTSPWDLHQRTWQEWLDSVRRGYRIAQGLADKVLLTGFSTGAALSLFVASENPAKLAGVVSVAAPLALQHKNIALVPWVSKLNRLVSAVTGNDGVVPFYASEPDHPALSYRAMPVQAVQQLIELMELLKQQLPKVKTPVLVMQADRDTVVSPASATEIFDRLGSAQKTIHSIATERHGILHENIGETQRLVLDFIKARRDA